MSNKAFSFITIPESKPSQKKTRVTSLIDKGLGLNALKDLLETSGEYISMIKLAFGTSRLYNKEFLQEKIQLIKKHSILACPGGTFLEICTLQNKVDLFFKECKELGFNAVEISDGAITLNERKEFLISSAKSLDFTVFSEIGKKDPEEDALISLEQRIDSIKRELDAGSSKVIIEARESGNLGIFDSKKEVKPDMLNKILSEVNIEDLIFEAPHKDQQIWFIENFGSDINLGNINPNDVLSLESLRTGIRGDTTFLFHKNEMSTHDNSL